MRGRALAGPLDAEGLRRLGGLERGASFYLASSLYRFNHLEMALVVVIVFVASLMARGFGQR